MTLARRFAGPGVALLVSVAACAGAPAPAPAPRPKSAAPALHQGPLTDFVPAAGLRWMVVGRPRALARHPSLAPAISLLLPKERLDAFSAGSGVDLRQLEYGLAAGFDYATLYLASPPDSADLVEKRFRSRLVSDPVEARPHPEILRITGIVGQTPQTLVRVDERLVAVSIGSATPARVVELFARGKLAKSPPALRGSALSSLPSDLDQAPLRFYAPGPFDGEWTHGARGLLAAATAVAAVARPVDGGRLRVQIFVAGDWSSTGMAGTSVMLDGWEDLARSGTGRLLGLNEPASGPSVDTRPGVLELRVELDTLTLARGLRAAVEADVWEILDTTPPR